MNSSCVPTHFWEAEVEARRIPDARGVNQTMSEGQDRLSRPEATLMEAIHAREGGDRMGCGLN